jgi:hypothetical protein
LQCKQGHPGHNSFSYVAHLQARRCWAQQAAVLVQKPILNAKAQGGEQAPRPAGSMIDNKIDASRQAQSLSWSARNMVQGARRHNTCRPYLPKKATTAQVCHGIHILQLVSALHLQQCAKWRPNPLSSSPPLKAAGNAPDLTARKLSSWLVAWTITSHKQSSTLWRNQQTRRDSPLPAW